MENITLKHILSGHVQHFPDKTAIIFSDPKLSATERKLTYREFNSRCCRLANGLLNMGFRKGDHIAMLSMNSSQYAELYWGFPKAGLVMVPINFRFVADEVAYIVNHSDAKAIIFEEQYLDLINSTRSQFDKVRSDGYIIIGDKAPQGMINYEKLLAKSADTEPQIEVEEMDPSILIYTSGTTARPKGVLKTEGAVLWLALQFLYHCGWSRDTATILATPHYHLGGTFPTHAAIYAGGTLIIQREFDSLNWLELVAKYRVSRFWIVPTMLNLIVNLPEAVRSKYDVSCVGDIMTSGAPLHAETWDRALKAFPNSKIHNLYASTEHGGATILYQREKDEHNLPSECIGLPALGANVKIGNNQGNELPRGETGEIWVKVPSNPIEYYKNPEATEEGFKDGWVSVGDLGRQDENGYYYIVDRKKDMIISGGENISPREIEEVIYRHPKVLEAAVIGVPDAKWGEAVKVVVVLRPGEKASQDEIISFCRGKIAGYKIPKSVDFVDHLPKTPTGKILKRNIRESYWAAHEGRVY